MESLAALGCRLHVLTSGNGLKYFSGKPGVESITEMGSLYYSGNRSGISGWSTLKSVGKLAAIGRSKREKLAQLLDKLRPDVAVIDPQLVGDLTLKAEQIAIELNQRVVRRAEWENTLLKPNDQIEIVHFVGGGCNANS